MPMICKLCGFTAAERSTTGSMKLHALRKHDEDDYLSLFQDSSKQKPEKPAQKPKKSKVDGSDSVKRLLNPKDPDERRAIAEGYKYMVEHGPNPDTDWDLVK